MNRKSFLKRVVIAAFVAPFAKAFAKDTPSVESSPRQIAPFVLHVGIGASPGEWPKEAILSHFPVTGSPEDMVRSAARNAAFIVAAQEQVMKLIPDTYEALSIRTEELFNRVITD